MLEVAIDPDDELPKWLDQMMMDNIAQPHRSKERVAPIFPACVARPVGKKELLGSKNALLARDREWDNLARKGTWDRKSVR